MFVWFVYFSRPSSFSIRNQSSRTVKHHTDHHINASEVETENIDMPIIIKVGYHDFPLRNENQQLLDLKGYMCRSKLNESTLLTIKCLELKRALEVNMVRKGRSDKRN